METRSWWNYSKLCSNWLQNCTPRVVISDSLSNNIGFNVAPLWSVMGQVLFTIFINDFAHEERESIYWVCRSCQLGDAASPLKERMKIQNDDDTLQKWSETKGHSRQVKARSVAQYVAQICSSCINTKW